MQAKDVQRSKIHRCNKCKDKTILSTDLQAHIRRHSGVKLKCSKCPKIYVHQKDFERHMRKDDGKIFRCPKCSYETTRRDLLRNHDLMTHTSDKPSFKCEVSKCGYETHLRQHLVSHSKKHNVIVLKCNDCSYSTTKKNR